MDSHSLATRGPHIFERRDLTFIRDGSRELGILFAPRDIPAKGIYSDAPGERELCNNVDIYLY